MVVAHYQIGRSIGRRRARAQRAHHSFDGPSRARRARLAAMRGSVALRVRDHAARRVRLARLGRRHLAAVPCQDTRFFPFASRHFHFALRTSEAGVKRNQPGRRTTRCSHTPSSIVRSYARNRVTDVTRRRNAVLVVGGWAAPASALWFRRPRTALGVGVDKAGSISWRSCTRRLVDLAARRLVGPSAHRPSGRGPGSGFALERRIAPPSRAGGLVPRRS